ncbi:MULTISPECIES: MipA/OmpV family protein [Phyllobacteriaceae]|jgi:MipA family protein|uniref:MltA-interacting MipA family protein n=1 Tax=Mesorhizobium hungaricum TaxID=1566387 RepID=A0A1C2EAT7_9HYPH|nr:MULTISPECIES: MipA/OmpV family protein [Mesorhizobium]MBN9235297.1 MipA/OmpV family protein [Mesorhizobium sp.]MDQ0332782.1 outer membrane scaffolding protein for murein synthesis (MipA/OmpV family) [Mesorhizobium sp. YL-MeA3-2017]OCX24103.1 MltA-interacting MipA family protein [Mesorhizobium hungaricum]
MSPARFLPAALAALVVAAPSGARAGDGFFDWIHGDWYLEVGVTGLVAPNFEGGKKYLLGAEPIISLGKAGNDTRFSSRNDNISLGLYDTGNFRAGLNGKLLLRRSSDTQGLEGLDPVPWGGELGGFAEFYPVDWVRVRGEVRQGVRAHHGVVADFAADAFYDVTPEVRISGGPRMSLASSRYFDAYYGVNAAEAATTGLAEYHPGGGVKSVGVGGAVTWKVSDPITASLFGEYSRLTGPAASSSLVKQNGSKDQFTIGISTSYRFDFKM